MRIRRIILWGFLSVIGIVTLCAGCVATEVGPKAAKMTTRWVCPCIYVEGRSVDYCMETMPIDVGPIVSVNNDTETRTVSARSLLFFSSAARYEEGLSCVMER